MTPTTPAPLPPPQRHQGHQPLDREGYNARFGPTTGDRIRLADTDLRIEVTDDWCGGPGNSGNEAVFGGGKVIRESMGQSKVPRSTAAPPAPEPPDTVITGAVILDHWGVVKADVAIHEGRIVALGKAYNPETMTALTFNDSRASNFVIGPETEVISGNGKILTAGAVDTHVHFICPEQINEALASGVTTLIGGGTGPAEGSTATTITPGCWHLTRMFRALDAFPVNIGLLGKGNTMSEDALKNQVAAGAIGLKIHEDWGATTEVLDLALQVCDTTGVQLALHADTMNEGGSVQDTIEAINGRSVHVFHVEGAGGGHAPDMIVMAGLKNVLPASTNPTRPFTVNTVDEHKDMVMVAHHLNPDVDEDRKLAESRIRDTTMSAEDELHDRGIISIMSSDSHAMGRIGEMITRTWQTAHVMKGHVGLLDADQGSERNNDGGNDNHRARRYIAKYTINPALAHSIGDHVGSVEEGRLADLVLWEPKFFGVKPHRVIKGGQIAYAQVGDANASITTPQPVLPRPVWGATGSAPAANSVNFATQDAINNHNLAGKVQVNKKFEPIKDTRPVFKKDMVHNDVHNDDPSDDSSIIEVNVDGDTFEVTIDGQPAQQHPPAERLPMAQRYFLF